MATRVTELDLEWVFSEGYFFGRSSLTPVGDTWTGYSLWQVLELVLAWDTLGRLT